MNRQDEVVIGVVQAPFGIKGWVKLKSYTDPMDNIFRYPAWVFSKTDQRRVVLCSGKRQANTLIACLDGVDDRDAAALFRGCEIYTDRTSFPQSRPGEYYWVDLIGLRVRNTQNIPLGTVVSMMATGANDVMVVEGERERLIPFVMNQFVRLVDLDEGFIEVEWDQDF